MLSLEVWTSKKKQHGTCRQTSIGKKLWSTSLRLGRRIDPPRIKNSGQEGTESNSKSRDRDVPIEDVVTMYESVAGQQATILKDDGCDTNVVSKRFLDRNGHLLKIKKVYDSH